MLHATHSARITGPVTFTIASGRKRTIPAGPCLVEELDDDLVDLVWGPAGEKSVVLPTTEANRAEREGLLVLLD